MAGYFALVLHAHLPFVRHPEHEHFVEEEWLFEAITETYIPLLRMMQRLIRDSVPFNLTMSLTPTLCSMLQDPLLCERYVRHLDLLIDLAARERKRNRKHPQLGELADFYFGLFSETRRCFVDEWHCDLISVIRQLRQTGALEIIASAATHGLLPILHQQSSRASRAQVLIGRDVYVELFGEDPAGFWLPECGYASGVEPVLQEANLRWFVIDAHGLLCGTPQARCSIYTPCYTPAGPAVFARNPAASRQVWSGQEGYPGHPAYRDFYRDIGFDLPMEYLGPIACGTRKFTGLKYHRITGRGDEKQLYDRTAAKATAGKHAIHFLQQCRQEIREIGEVGFDPIIVAPFDAELFGHWWFEGPIFLEQFIRHAANDAEFQFTSPSRYLAEHPTQQIVEPTASTWGENGHLAMWLDPSNAWIYGELHSAVNHLTELAQEHVGAIAGEPLRQSEARLPVITPALQPTERVLKQLARELLLAQASDWGFLIKTGTAREYAIRRTTEHLVRFNRLHDQFVTDDLDGSFLRDCEWRDNIFPNVNWRYYA